MDFLDEAEVEFESGTGGDGAVAFHREKHVPRGGPNGADGGRGGDVVLVADRHKRTLYDFKLKRKFKAESGENAHGNKHGKDGKGLEIFVPVGTTIVDLETGEPIVDLATDGTRFVVCRGGRGGMGNLRYTNSVRQSPAFAEKGAPAETLYARLELKLLADVGLVGLPNAGKSTLLGSVSAAKPKIADYPFTTIVPNLGVVKVHENTFVIADLPGLIEGASDGAGLGHRFLRHAERTRVIIHVLDAFPIDESDPLTNFEIIESELERYSPELASRPRLVALNKIDLGPKESVDQLAEALRPKGFSIFPISGATSQGVSALMDAAWHVVQEADANAPEVVMVPERRRTEDEGWTVTFDAEAGEYLIVGKRVERMIAMTDLDNGEAVRYLHRRLDRMGVIQALRDAGAEDDDNVRVGEYGFTFREGA